MAAQDSERARAEIEKAAIVKHKKAKMHWEAKKRRRASLTQTSAGRVVEGPCEWNVGARGGGLFGRESWVVRYAIFDQQRDRLTVHDPFEPPKSSGPKSANLPSLGLAPYTLEAAVRVVSGTALYKVAPK
jgi:hypothetical protein